MTALVRAEFRKLFTTRLWLWLSLAALGFTAIAVVATIAVAGTPAGAAALPLDSDAGLHNLFASAASGTALLLVLGAVGVTAEFRYLTATPTFLATPRRARVIVAKMIAYAGYGAGYALVAIAVVLAIALPWLPAKGIHVSVTGHGIPGVMAAAVAVCVIYTVVGVGVGALVRNQVAAIVGSLLYLFVLEGLLSLIPVVRDYYRFLPGGASSALIGVTTGREDLLQPWQGGLLFLGYGIAFAAIAVASTLRRDVT